MCFCRHKQRNAGLHDFGASMLDLDFAFGSVCMDQSPDRYQRSVMIMSVGQVASLLDSIRADCLVTCLCMSRTKLCTGANFSTN